MGLNKEKIKTISFKFLLDSCQYELTLITDGKYDKDYLTQYLVVDKTSTVDINLLCRFGFAATLKPL